MAWNFGVVIFRVIAFPKPRQWRVLIEAGLRDTIIIIDQLADELIAMLV